MSERCVGTVWEEKEGGVKGGRGRTGAWEGLVWGGMLEGQFCECVFPRAIQLSRRDPDRY